MSDEGASSTVVMNDTNTYRYLLYASTFTFYFSWLVFQISMVQRPRQASAQRIEILIVWPKKFHKPSYSSF